jgi:ABC-2 type transport system ATP-binding protein
MSQAEVLCDRVALIHRGRLMVYGDVGDVRRRHSSPEVRVRVLGALPEIPETAGAVQGADGDWRIATEAGREPADLLRSLIVAGAHVHSFEPMLAPMEDVFLRIVSEAGYAPLA